MKTKLHCFVTAMVATIITALGLQLALAQTPDPAAFVTTDQPGYQPGGTVHITGGGFQAGETVALQVLRTDTEICPSPGHAPWEVVADDTGAIVAEWVICPGDGVGTPFQLGAAGQTSTLTALTTFQIGAAIAAYVTTDQADYPPGSTVYITGGGFDAGENVSVQVVHADGTGTNDPVHQPWTVVADTNGVFQTSWNVGNDHLGASLQVLASRQPPGVTAQAAFTDSGGPSGYALAFDGLNDYVRVLDAADLRVSDRLTIECWIRTPAVFTYGTLVSKYEDDTDQRGWMVNFGEMGVLNHLCVVFTAQGAWLPDYLQWDTGLSFIANTWYHVAVTHDASLPNNNVKVYVNGSLGAQTTWAHPVFANMANLLIGGYDGWGNGFNSGANSRWYSGQIDEVRIWNVARTEAEIQANMNQPLVGNESGLVAY